MSTAVKHPPSCMWAGAESNGGLGWLSPEHLRDCADPRCRGCKPCREHHCALRGRCPHHVQVEAGIITCPSCIGRTRRDLAAIVELYALVPTHVEDRGAGPDAGPAPLLEEAADAGLESEAFNLIGPAADPGQFAERRRRLAAAYAARGWCDWPRLEVMADDDPHHPYLVLGRWDLALREEYGPYTDLLTTVSRAADYLTSLLAETFPHTREFEEFATEIATCRTHLESVVHDSRRPELGRPCPLCAEEREDGRGPRLRKRYAAHPGLPAGVRCGAKDGSQGQVTACNVCDGTEDTWHCPDVGAHWWSDADYRARVDADYLDHAPELPGRELAERIGVSYATIRKWCARRWDARAEVWIEPRLVSRRRGADGRKLYRVADALRLAEERRRAVDDVGA